MSKENCKIEVFTKEVCGKIKKLNGGNMAPPISGEKAGMSLRKPFGEMNLALTRLHDAPLDNPGCKLVDVHQIFANFHADADDPRNYYFKQTDDYIKNCIELGCPVYYRLGTSIEHSCNKYFTGIPEDVDKWIDICDHIIRHYTEGWNNGFNFRIRYWEIWNEPEVCDGDGLHLMWAGSMQDYCEFYVKAATELKKRFPHLMIGGPAQCSYNQHTKPFIKYCADHKAPLDFYSYHMYASDPYTWIQETAHLVKKDLEEAGYKDAEVHLNEWHYFPGGDWKRLREDPEYKKQTFAEMKGIHSAAFLCTVMALWQDTPMDMGCYYTCTASAWGLFETRSTIPTKSYYGMKAFGEIVRYPERLKAASSCKDVTVLAGQNEKGKKGLLLSAFKLEEEMSVTITLDEAPREGSVKMLLLNNEKDLVEVPVSFKGNELTLPLEKGSTVAVITFE